MVERSGVEGEARRMGSDAGRNTTTENREVDMGSRHEAQRIYRKQLMYYTISRAFIVISGIVVSYSFPQVLSSSYL
jgi:hypothetical protein